MIAALVTMVIGAFIVWSTVPAEIGAFPAVALFLGAAVMAAFLSLTVEIDGATLTVKFGPGLIRKRIPIAEIERATAVKNPWFIGWGIRWYPGHCWVWNISGLQAVELDLKGGRKFRIGTDEPAALVEAITIARSLAGHGG
jgi:hypothetical protein